MSISSYRYVGYSRGTILPGLLGFALGLGSTKTEGKREKENEVPAVKHFDDDNNNN
jgi:hypothetical protein